MKIAVLGGGFTGLTTSYFLIKKGHRVTLFEKEKVLGGLASGFITKRWEWYLERTVHHLFANDNDILNFARETGFGGIFFHSPETASLYNSRIFPLDSPQDFLRFPLLDLSQKLRAGAILLFLKISPLFFWYERQTAEEFLKKTMGREAWNILWRELFRKKFGKYAENILASFIWARIKKRTKRLGYIEGGFQKFIDFLENKEQLLGIEIKKGYKIESIEKRAGEFRIGADDFDAVVSTLPTPVITHIAADLFPLNYVQQLKNISYLNAISLVLESKTPLLERSYWLNIAEPRIPIMGIFQHTNFVNKEHYGGNHIAYLGWYVDAGDKLWKMNSNELLTFVFPHLKKIFNFKFKIKNSYLFKASFAQPIFDKDFLRCKPSFETPIKNFYIANLDMTYPYDRGTNYAISLGKQVARFL